MQNDPKPGEDFPMICEICLGNNPYMRMTKLPFGQKICKVSNLPYQPFRWKAGTHGRFKETIISFVVAKEKNICQACLNDMQFGLPVGVRDAMLRQQTAEPIALAPVHSIVGTRYHYQQLTKRHSEIEDSYGDSELALTAAAHQDYSRTQQQQQLLQGFSQHINEQNIALRPNAPASSSSVVDKSHQRPPDVIPFRNLPSLCTFWLSGTCRRVTNKSCPYRPCCGIYQFPELAGGDNTMREANQKLIEQLQESGPDKVQRSMDKNVRQVLDRALKRRKSNSSENTRGVSVDESIRSRVHGTDALSKKYLGQLQNQVDKQSQQEDRNQQEISKGSNDPAYHSVTSLWIGNLPAVRHNSEDTSTGAVDPVLGKNILKQTLSTALHRYSIPIVSIHIPQSLAHAFIDYGDHGLALHALQLMLHDPPLVPSPVLLMPSNPPAVVLSSSLAMSVTWQPLTLIRWATPPSLKHAQSLHSSSLNSELMPAPPGMEYVHPDRYSLPNAPAPKLPVHFEQTASSKPPPPTSSPLSASRPSLEGAQPDAKRRKVHEQSDHHSYQNQENALSSLLSGYGSSDEDNEK